MQGVIKSYDPGTGDGVVVRDTDLADIDLARDALDGSVFRMLRQGQRVVFDLDPVGQATALRLGSEVDMGTPGFPRRGSGAIIASGPPPPASGPPPAAEPPAIPSAPDAVPNGAAPAPPAPPESADPV